MNVDLGRASSRAYELVLQVGFLHCQEHDYTTPLARWHCHEDYEFHLIVETSGKAFVGYWIGPFEPGHCVLCGPQLPHNWVSLDLPPGGVARRDLFIQFRHEPLEAAARGIPELAEVLLLLERSRQGIEFLGFAGKALAHWNRINAASGVARLAAFLDLLAELTHWEDYRLLSSVQLRGADNAADLGRVNSIVNRIMQRVGKPLTAAEVAADLGMSESRFSRFFRRVTGNTYTDFVNRACHLLMNSDRYITCVCYEAGFNKVANFNRCFREVKGMTPSEFHNQSRARFGVSG